MAADTLAALRRGDLAGARALDLSGLGLREVPDEVFALAPTLERLDLGGNALDDLPPATASLGRLRVLFCSGNRFPRLPPVLGDCAALQQIGCRDAGVAELPAESLPPGLRWLTLTGNRLQHLPDALGERPALRKLMLSGNRLLALPGRLAGAASLELLRLGANRLPSLPPWLAELPSLAWLAWAGNPFGPGFPAAEAVAVPWGALLPGASLGGGASGRVLAADWRAEDGAARPVAVKLFRGALTSDGLPEHEVAAQLAAGAHPNLVGALGRLRGHPDGLDGLVMPRLPASWRPLAGPPSAESCSRDVYDPALRLRPDAALRLARGAGAAAAQLHGRGVLHGDLYAHNLLWDGEDGDCALGDFGAASPLPPGPPGRALAALECRAWGLLLDELLDRCGDFPGAPAARALAARCAGPVADRPSMAEALRALAVAG